MNEIRNINESDERYFKGNINEIFKKPPFVNDENDETQNKKEMDSDELSEFNKYAKKARESIDHAISIYKSRQKLKALWPEIVLDYIQEVINDLQAA